VLGITFSDLRFRFRQFLIAVAGAGLVFSMSLLMSGLANGFSYEINQTVQGFGADAWVVAHGSAARIAALSPLPESDVSEVAKAPGVKSATAVIVMPREATVAGRTINIALIGSQSGVPTPKDLSAGHPVNGPGQTVVDARLGAHVGERIALNGHPYLVVGTVSGRTLLGGLPDVYVNNRDAQSLAFAGAHVISAVITKGVPHGLPPRLAVVTNQELEQSSLAGMSTAVSSINNSKWLMWLIASVIIAALVYVTALQRTRDFAVLKALGCTSRKLFGGLAIQSVAIALAASVVALIISGFMKGVFAQPVEIPGSAYLALPLSALIVGLVASLIALRRAISVDPAAAFAGG